MLPVRITRPVKPVKVLPVSNNIFQLLSHYNDEDFKTNIEIKKNLEYTLDGECLGTVDDIVWGYGFKGSISTQWGIKCGV